MSVVAFSQAFQPRENGTAAVHALRGQLQSLREVITTLSPEVYGATPSPVSGSIGGHVRHCLDHVRALAGFRGSGDLTYDSRLRGTPIETDPWAAVEEIDRLDLQIERSHVTRPGAAVRLRAMTDRDGTEVHVQSTIGRELAFVIQHTIHHAAIIAVLLGQIGVAVPAGFGYAPSTLAHR